MNNKKIVFIFEYQNINEKMKLTKAQEDIIYRIAKVQVKDLTYIMVENKYEPIYYEMIEENYEVTMKEIAQEVRIQLRQWAKLKRDPSSFSKLLDSTEKGWLRHHVFHYYMKNSSAPGLWAMLNMEERFNDLNLN